MNTLPNRINAFLSGTQWYVLLVVIIAIVGACAGVVVILSRVEPFVSMFVLGSAILLPWAIINPRWGLLLFLWFANTIDAAKRALYAMTNFSPLEVAQILFVPVMIAAALYVRVCFLSWFGRDEVARVRILRFWPMLLVIAGGAAFVLRGGVSFESLSANYAFVCYIPAGLAVPHIIYNFNRQIQFSKTLLIIGLVLGVYGVVQIFHGPLAYELPYIRSGLSITIASIEGAYFRAFSLLNNGATFAGVMVMCTFFAFAYLCRNDGQIRVKTSVVLLTLFTTAVVFGSTQRGALLCFLLTLALIPLFSRPRAFLIASGVGILMFAALIYFSLDLLDALGEGNDVLVSAFEGNFMLQSANILTYGQRLNSFADLGNPALWTPFGSILHIGDNGVQARGLAGYHDLLSNCLEWFGYVGTSIFFSLSGALVFFATRRMGRLRREDPEAFLWAECNLAVFLFTMIWSILTGSAIHVSPMNFYFWVSIGNLLFVTTSLEKSHEPVPGSPADRQVSNSSSRHVWHPVA